VTIPPTSASAFAPAALIDRDQISIVELRESDPKLVVLVHEAEDFELAADRKGKRAEYYCVACGYGIVVYGRPPGCPMCSEGRWEQVEWRPSSQPLDDLALPFGTLSQRRRLHALPSPTAEEPIRYLRPVQAGASLEK
jgi:hypothetical protein